MASFFCCLTNETNFERPIVPESALSTYAQWTSFVCMNLISFWGLTRNEPSLMIKWAPLIWLILNEPSIVELGIFGLRFNVTIESKISSFVNISPDVTSLIVNFNWLSRRRVLNEHFFIDE